jgi:hypothetical protein
MVPIIGFLFKFSTQTGQTTFLHLGKCSAPGQKCDHSKSSQDRQCLKKVPDRIVEEEGAFDANNRADEQRVREWSVGHGFGDVINVAAQIGPLRWISNIQDAQDFAITHSSEQRRKRRYDCQQKEATDGNIGALWVGPENVVNLGQFSISYGFLGCRNRDVRVQFNGQGKRFAVVPFRGAEGGNDDARRQRGGGAEEL